MYRNNQKRLYNEETYRTPKFARDTTHNSDTNIRTYLETISEERGTYPHKYRYIPATGQVLMEYSTMKQLKEAVEVIKQQQKAEEEKKRQEEEQKKQEAFIQKIAQFLQPKEDPPKPSPIPCQVTPPNYGNRSENLVTVDMLTRQKEEIISTITQTIREQQLNYNPPSYQRNEINNKEGHELDKKAWNNWITNKLHRMKARKEWLPTLETIRKKFKINIEVDFEGLNKKDAITKLAKQFAKHGSPSEDLMYETDYDSN